MSLFSLFLGQVAPVVPTQAGNLENSTVRWAEREFCDAPPPRWRSTWRQSSGPRRIASTVPSISRSGMLLTAAHALGKEQLRYKTQVSVRQGELLGGRIPKGHRGTEQNLLQHLMLFHSGFLFFCLSLSQVILAGLVYSRGVIF